MFVIETLYNLAKSTFSNYFYKLIPVSDMITFLNFIVTFFIVKTIVNKSLRLRRFKFDCILAQKVNLFMFINFSFLKFG